MVYIDTSALVPLFIREPSSDAVIDWLASSEESFAISEWTLVEFASATSIKQRAGQAPASLIKRATARMHEFVQKHCTVAVLARENFHRARELAGDAALKLRAGDALHLAMAEGLNAQSILCLDQPMIESAKVLGLAVAEI
jgi:predicted nucleic acid-binding protein